MLFFIFIQRHFSVCHRQEKQHEPSALHAIQFKQLSTTMPSRILSAAAVTATCAFVATLPEPTYAFAPHASMQSLHSLNHANSINTSSKNNRPRHAPLTSVFSCSSNDVGNASSDSVDPVDDASRRTAISNLSLVTSTLIGLGAPQLASAASATDTAEPFVRQGKGYGYTFVPPPGFAPGKKPVQTHLDEVNFNLEGVAKYTYGVTVDPVRINSLTEFGKPEEVAARVVTAEVNRDGIFEVTLAKDPVEDGETGAYAIDYVSDGKRGKKHFVTRIFVKDQKLYVMTAQVKEEEYAEREKEIMECVKTFKPL